jgi:3-methyladenine DNA glycosylase AlkD
MTAEAMVKRIDGWLRERADAEFGAGQRRFFQHEVASYGTRGDAVREVARLVYGEVKTWAPEQRQELMERLWKLGRLESGAVVCHVMRRFARGFGRREFELFERWLEDHVRNWAHTDGVASWLVAGCLARDERLLARVWGWTDSPNRWKRRAAAVSLLQEAKQGRQTEFVLRVAKKLLPDRDGMVEKGVGWLLKEAYPRRPAEVVRFLVEEGMRASRLTLRYAAEKMTAADRRRVLGGGAGEKSARKRGGRAKPDS